MKRSIPQIIANKILDHIEHQSLGDILIRSLMILVAIIATLAVLYPATTQSIAREIAAWNNYAFVKSVFIFGLVFNLSRIGKLAITIYKNRPVPEKKATGDTIEGIPTLELLDHLFEHQSFKREDIENKFIISRNRYSTLATKLESIGILKRGENNSRILNEEYTRADIANILKGVENARDLKPVFRQVGPTSFTREPQGQTIMEKVQEALSPLPSPARFERKLIKS